MLDFLTLLRENPYPGRGILVSRDLVYYFIMGRSANSRNRIFVTTGDGIRTEAYDPAKLEDPSLIIYHPVRTMGSALVVTNGDQTDTVCQYGDFRKGLMTREYEPDDPNWTPRISAILNADGSFELSILKRKTDAACANFSAMRASTPDRDTSSAPIRATAVPCRPSPASRWRSPCRRRRKSGRHSTRTTRCPFTRT